VTKTFHVVCQECGDWWGPYAGTTWKTPREHAQTALGGIDHDHPIDGLDLRVV